jgi:hypothetical protein
MCERTPAVNDIREFVEARLVEDEQVALAAPRHNWTVYLAGDPGGDEGTEQRVLDHVIRHDPARVLAEVAVKRRILEEHRRIDDDTALPAGLCSTCAYGDPLYYQAGPCKTVYLLATPFVGHQDFDPAWTSWLEDRAS